MRLTVDFGETKMERLYTLTKCHLKVLSYVIKLISKEENLQPGSSYRFENNLDKNRCLNITIIFNISE